MSSGVGQRVACAGDQYAHHAEFNGFRPISASLSPMASPQAAAFVRRVHRSPWVPTFRRCSGDTVIGLGLVGQLLVQILRLAGAHCAGCGDVSGMRPCGQEGATAAAAPGSADFEALRQSLHRLTDGAGADHVFLAAGTKERDPIVLAENLPGAPATIVDIGKTNLDLPEAPTTSSLRSGCPGRTGLGPRYDPSYEEDGVDYPIGYVRWTQRRNLSAFLDLVAEGRIDLVPLISEVFTSIAVQVYARLHDGSLGGIGNIFRYAGPEVPMRQLSTRVSPPRRPRDLPAMWCGIGVAIGAGNYASTMLLPTLPDGPTSNWPRWSPGALSAATAAGICEVFVTTATDLDGLLSDERVPAELIATRQQREPRCPRRPCTAGGQGRALVGEAFGRGPHPVGFRLSRGCSPATDR